MHDYGHAVMADLDAEHRDYRTAFMAGLKDTLAAAGREYCTANAAPIDLALTLDQRWLQLEAEAAIGRAAIQERYHSSLLRA